MKEVILIRIGELFLKGANRGFFEKVLYHNLKRAVSFSGAKVIKISSRYLVQDYNVPSSELAEKISTVFGITSFSNAFEIDSNLNLIFEACGSIDFKDIKTFKVETKRADKKFELTSYEVSKEVGSVILEKNPHLKVDVTKPEKVVYIDIRENGKTYVMHDKINGAGGMPVGTAGKGLLMLSGGIDSPVAGYYMAKRGLQLSAIHFHSFPFTSEDAKQKVISLARLLTKYTGNINLFVVPFTEIQEQIHKNCDSKYMITIMRRFMMKIAEQCAMQNELGAIITGENLGQVASQTLHSITTSNAVVTNIPVMRPLIGFDKTEIVEVSKKIGTYETSILPYEDCCTVFLPKNPATKPQIKNVERQESQLDVEKLIENCIAKIEIIKIRANETDKN